MGRFGGTKTTEDWIESVFTQRITTKQQPCSSVSEGLLRHIVVLFFSTVDQFHSVWVLPSCERLLSLLIGDKRLCLFNIVTFTLGKSQVITLIGPAPHGWKDVRADQIEKLRHVDHVEELCSVAHIKPHPVTVGLQTDWLQTKELQEVRAKGN